MESIAERTTLIRQFCDLVNAGLPAQDKSAITLAALRAANPLAAPTLFDDLDVSFRQARQPAADRYYHCALRGADARFEQCYELLRRTFDETEREPRERYVHTITLGQDPKADHPNIMVGRFWGTDGLCEYDENNQLIRYDYSPLHRASYILSLVNGNYMRIKHAAFMNDSFGAIGHTAPYIPTLETNLPVLLAFEEEMKKLAVIRGQTLRLFMVEAEDDSDNFYYAAGYRWPKGCKYDQPPMEFDPKTGVPYHPAVPQTLMVKLVDQPDATSIDATLLKAAARTMVDCWCLIDVDMTDFKPAAVARAKKEVDAVMARFDASLSGTSIPLVDPTRR